MRKLLDCLRDLTWTSWSHKWDGFGTEHKPSMSDLARQQMFRQNPDSPTYLWKLLHESYIFGKGCLSMVSIRVEWLVSIKLPIIFSGENTQHWLKTRLYDHCRIFCNFKIFSISDGLRKTKQQSRQGLLALLLQCCLLLLNYFRQLKFTPIFLQHKLN